MKKIQLLIMSLGVNIAFAQTNTFPNSGNAGIGTTTPSVELEVLGTIDATTMVTSYLEAGDGAAGTAFISAAGFGSLPGSLVDLLYLENGWGERVLEANNLGGNSIYIGEITGSGDEAIAYFGDSNHFFKSKYGNGITIGTFGASNGITLKETSGNVGIGTDSPQAKLHVSGSTRLSGLSGSGYRMVVADGDGDLSTQAIPTFSGDNMGNHSSTQNIKLNGNWMSGDGGNEGIKVDNVGRVGIGMTPSGGTNQLSVNGPIRATGGIGINTLPSAFLAINASGNSDLLGFVGIGTVNDASLTHRLTVSGSAQKNSGGTAWATFSDARLKDVQGNIKDALNIINNLNPVVYHWNDLRNSLFGEDEQQGQKYGFLAQELAEVIPEFVYDGGDGYLRYNPSGIEAILVAAIQEQSNVLESYKDELNELRDRLDICCSSFNQPQSQSRSLMEQRKFKSVLSQNRPNPFHDKTIISYELLDPCEEASVIVTDLNGQKLLAFSNLNYKEGFIEISHDDLNPGLFLYSLVLDGHVVDTKRMVVTD